MNYQDRRQWRGCSRAIGGLSPERAAEALSKALEWREEWRAEMARRAARSDQQAAVGRQYRRDEEADRRAKFAEAIARTELGRAYWDKRLHGATRQSNRRE